MDTDYFNFKGGPGSTITMGQSTQQSGPMSRTRGKPMKKISNRAVVVLGCALTLLIPKSARSATTAVQRLEINVCEFKVPAELAMANATFTVAYVVQVGEDGRPIKVDKEKNDFLTD